MAQGRLGFLAPLLLVLLSSCVRFGFPSDGDARAPVDDAITDSESLRDCEDPATPPGSACDDGDPCTVGDACHSGRCVPGVDPKDSDGDGFIDDSCADGTDCDDTTNAIHPAIREGPVADTTCRDGHDNNCNGRIDNDDSGCNVAADCSSPDTPEGAFCDDDNLCTRTDLCQEGSCQGLDPIVCAATDDCHLPGGCDPLTAECSNPPKEDGEACDNGDPCSTLDSCNGGSCTAGQTNKDTDQDGFLDGACPNGNDCLDTNRDVHPLAVEGPVADPTCSDTLDNNCNGGADDLEPACTTTVGACSLDSWCWVHPLPTGQDLQAVWGSSADDVWAVGNEGTLLRFLDGVWSAQASGTTEDLHDVHGSGPGDVWAVGNQGTVLHFNGNGWQSMTPGTTETLRGVWADGPGGAWVAGANTLLRRHDGSWQSAAEGTGRDLYAVYGIASDDVWAVGRGAGVAVGLRWDGNNWTQHALRGGGTAYSVWGTTTSDVFACGAAFISRWTGSWTELETARGTYNGIWGSRPDNIWFAGDALLRWDGSEFHADAVGMENPGYSDVWANSDTNAWVVGPRGKILRRTTLGWGSVSHQEHEHLTDVSGTSASDVWAVTRFGRALHYDGATWSPRSTGLADDLNAVWAVTTDNAWFAGRQGAIAQWDGDGFVDRSLGDIEWKAIWASAVNDVWVVGSAATAHWNGTAWTMHDPGTTGWIVGVWGSASDDVWAVEQGGTILHWNGSAWSVDESALGCCWEDVWGTSPSDIWAVGSAGRTLHYDGDTWAAVSTDTTAWLKSVWGVGVGRVWAAGELASDGIILRLNGNSWQRESSSMTIPRRLNALWGTTDAGMFAVGDIGFMLRKAAPL